MSFIFFIGHKPLWCSDTNLITALAVCFLLAMCFWIWNQQK